MNKVLNDDGLNPLLREARTHTAWPNQPVAGNPHAYAMHDLRNMSAISQARRFN
jgi:hypothetical protein